jgi:hypothetical protein
MSHVIVLGIVAGVEHRKRGCQVQTHESVAVEGPASMQGCRTGSPAGVYLVGTGNPLATSG